MRIPWGLAVEARDTDEAPAVAGLLHFLVNCDNSGGRISFSGPFCTVVGTLLGNGTEAFEITGTLGLLITPVGPTGLTFGPPILRSPNLLAASILNLRSLSSSVSIFFLSSAKPPGAVIVASLLNFSTISLFKPPLPSLHPPPLRAFNSCVGVVSFLFLSPTSRFIFRITSFVLDPCAVFQPSPVAPQPPPPPPLPLLRPQPEPQEGLGARRAAAEPVSSVGRSLAFWAERAESWSLSLLAAEAVASSNSQPCFCK